MWEVYSSEEHIVQFPSSIELIPLQKKYHKKWLLNKASWNLRTSYLRTYMKLMAGGQNLIIINVCAHVYLYL